MLSAPPAFILSQDRTLRSNSPGRFATLHTECGSVWAGDPLILRTHEIHSRNIRDVPYLCGPGPLRGRSNSLVCLRRSHRSLYPVVKVRRADAPRKEIIYTIGGGPGAGMRRFTIPTQRPRRNNQQPMNVPERQHPCHLRTISFYPVWLFSIPGFQRMLHYLFCRRSSRFGTTNMHLLDPQHHHPRGLHSHMSTIEQTFIMRRRPE